ILIASIKAAGVGVTLTRSHRMVFVEHWWTPGINAQAMDRADRIGQEKLVEITHMVAVGTFDEQVHNVLANKMDYLRVIDPTGQGRQSQHLEPRTDQLLADLLRAAVTGASRQAAEASQHCRGTDRAIGYEVKHLPIPHCSGFLSFGG